MESENLVEKQEILLVTREECVEIVRQTLNLEKVHIINYTIEAASDVTYGFLGEYYRLVITIQKNSAEKKLYYFLKSLPIRDKQHRQVVELFGFFYKEFHFYSTLLPKLKWNTGSSKWRPNCYLSRNDLLVLEELEHLGYAHIPDRTEYTEKSIQEVLKCLARMHASSLEFETKHCENTRIDAIYDKIFFEIQIIKKNFWFTAGLKAIQAYAERKSTFKDHPVVRDGMLMEKMEKVYELSETTSEFQNVLCHRDLWNKNIMFQFPTLDNGQIDYENPKHCLFVDFQMYRYNPPAIDVLLAIYFNTRRRHREENLEKYLEFYYDYLQQELKKYDIDVTKMVPWDEFQRCRKHYMLKILIFNCIFIPLTHLKPGQVKQMHKEDPDKYHLICNIDRSDFVLENMDLDEYYKEYVTESMEELLEYICSCE